MYLRLISFIVPRWRLTGLGFLITFICLLLFLIQPYLISRFIDEVLIGHNTELIIPILSISLGLSILAAILRVFGFSIFRFLEARNTLDLRSVVLRHIRKIPLPEIEKTGAGKYMALMGMDTTTTAKFINVVAVELCNLWVQMLMSLGIIFYLDWRLGIVAIVCIPIVLAVPRLFKRAIKSTVNSLRSHNEDIGTYMYESIQGSREIRTYGLEAWEEERNEVMYKNLVKVSVYEGFFRQVSGQTGGLIVAVAVTLIYGFGSGNVISGVLSVGMMVASIQYIYNVLNPIQSMNYLISDLLGSEVAMSRIEEFLKQPVELPAKSKESISEANRDPVDQAAYISCENLCVSYEGTSILKGINLEIRKGQVAAFVGRSGSGKSTLFKAIQGLMPIESGHVWFNQISLESMSRKEISDQVSFVSQETFLFKGTLFENVSLGKLDATEDEVYKALCEVDLKTFVDELRDGMYTQIDNQGFRLSGGQRQRMAIARAIIKQPNILFLDEPTSSLDRNTEEQVLLTINRIMHNNTTLISTHRIESIRHADIIYVMDQGKIIDSGIHEDLMSRCHIYINLVKSQEFLKQSEIQAV